MLTAVATTHYTGIQSYDGFLGMDKPCFCYGLPTDGTSNKLSAFCIATSKACQFIFTMYTHKLDSKASNKRSGSYTWFKWFYVERKGTTFDMPTQTLHYFETCKECYMHMHNTQGRDLKPCYNTQLHLLLPSYLNSTFHTNSTGHIFILCSTYCLHTTP